MTIASLLSGLALFAMGAGPGDAPLSPAAQAKATREDMTQDEKQAVSAMAASFKSNRAS